MPSLRFLQTLEAASQRNKDRHTRGPIAVAARHDPDLGRIVVSLSTGLDVSFRPQDAQGLENAEPDQLATIEVSPSGQGLHIPTLDADFFVPALLEGFLGSKAWIAARLGAAGGRSTSDAKGAAARANGRRGERSRKAAVS
jgi:hypothetical protein